MARARGVKMAKLIWCVCLGLGIVGCAQTTVKRVNYNDTTTEGLRVYDPLPLIIVTCQNVQLISIPDFNRGYAVSFDAFMAKNESTAKVTEGLITELSAKLDNTGLLSLLQSWGEKALGSAKDLAALGAQVPGGIPGLEGVWRPNFDAQGRFTNMTQVHAATQSCPDPNGGAPVPGGKPAPKPGPAKGPNPPEKFP